MLTGLTERLRTRTGERWLTAGCFVLLFAAHALLVRPVLQNGDTAVYNDQIDAHRQLSTNLAYEDASA